MNIKHWFQNYYQDEKLHYNFRKRKSLRALHPFRGFLHEKATAKNKSWEEGGGSCAMLPASEVCTSFSHGFALRASPAVKHGVSPPGTVGENAMSLGRVDAIRVWADRIRV